jgi:hypothetical protein
VQRAHEKKLFACSTTLSKSSLDEKVVFQLSDIGYPTEHPSVSLAPSTGIRLGSFGACDDEGPVWLEAARLTRRTAILADGNS